MIFFSVMALHVILVAKDCSSNIALNLRRSKRVEMRLIYRYTRDSVKTDFGLLKTLVKF